MRRSDNVTSGGCAHGFFLSVGCRVLWGEPQLWETVALVYASPKARWDGCCFDWLDGGREAEGWDSGNCDGSVLAVVAYPRSYVKLAQCVSSGAAQQRVSSLVEDGGGK